MALSLVTNSLISSNFEFPLMTKAGARIYVLLNATTRRDDQGNAIGVVGIGQDITGEYLFSRARTILPILHQP